jgi:hypothetical protein
VTYVGPSSDYNPNNPGASKDRFEGCTSVQRVATMRQALSRTDALRLALGLAPVLRMPSVPRF